MKKENILDVIHRYPTIGDIPTRHLAAFLDEVKSVRLHSFCFFILGICAFALVIIIQIVHQ